MRVRGLCGEHGRRQRARLDGGQCSFGSPSIVRGESSELHHESRASAGNERTHELQGGKAEAAMRQRRNSCRTSAIRLGCAVRHRVAGEGAHGDAAPLFHADNCCTLQRSPPKLQQVTQLRPRTEQRRRRAYRTLQAANDLRRCWVGHLWWRRAVRAWAAKCNLSALPLFCHSLQKQRRHSRRSTTIELRFAFRQGREWDVREREHERNRSKLA